MAILSFRTADLALIAARRMPSRRFPADLVRVTQHKLAMLNAATRLDDLRAPPANRLESLHGDCAGQHAIRVNDQFRVCFAWAPAGPEALEFVDYH